MKHFTIISALLMAFATQVVGTPFNCHKEPEQKLLGKPISGVDPTYEFSKPKFYEGASCSSMCPDINAIYDNCFVDKMKGTSKVATQSVRRSCERIACNPTFFQKLRYK
jgi:hypothetical protein